MNTRNPYPSDVSDGEWAFAAAYLTLLPDDAGQRDYELREVYNGLALDGAHGSRPFRIIPSLIRHPGTSSISRRERWLAAGCFEAVVEDLRLLLHGVKGRKGQPGAAIFESRVLQSTPRAVVVMGATMAPNVAKEAKCMWPSVPGGIC